MISVIVPIFNSQKTLAQCLDSILTQTYQDFELILVNDGSTDRSEDICLGFERQYCGKIKYYKKENGGVSSARNYGIENAQKEFVCFIDSDDYVESTYLETLVNSLIEYKADFSMCDICGNSTESNEFIRLSDNNDIINAIISDEYGQTNRGPYCKLFYKHIIGDLRFNENIYLGEDTLFSIEYAKRCTHGIYVRKGLYHYEFSTSSVLYRSDPRLLKKYLTYIDSRREMLKNTSMLNRHTFVLLANSLFKSIQESYFVARSAQCMEVQLSLCGLMKEVLGTYNISLRKQESPLSWYIMANWPRYFDKWMFLYGKYHGLLNRLGLFR